MKLVKENLNENYVNPIEKILNKLGIEVKDDGLVIVKSRFGRILCYMAVKDRIFERIDKDTYKLIN